MFNILPEEFVVQQFLIYAGYARRKPSGIYEGGCPTCKEGKSWGQKRRLFYIPEYNNIHCKNCHRSWFPKQWIAEISGKSHYEIEEEAKEYEYIPIDLIDKKHIQESVIVTDILPRDAINLGDKQQLEYYKRNDIINKCITFMTSRRLNTAINRPKDFYISLTDKTHKNRLCIPFTNADGDVEFYQTRSFIKNKDDMLPKYLGKVGGDKIIFGINNISEDLDYIFIFEGPIDSMFVKNGIAIGGVDITSIQKDVLKAFPFHKKIWVLDNQNIDETSREVTKRLLKEGETIFIWKKGLEKFKDFNDICIYKKLNEIPTTYIIENSFSGIKGKFQLAKLDL